MTCWIEDELHLEEHYHPPTYPKGRRPCSVYCTEDVHATVAFITGRVSADDAPGHAGGQLAAHHRLVAVKVEPAHEVTPEMYPNRTHHGTPAESGEGLTAWLIYWRKRT